MRCLTCDCGGSSIKYALVDDNANIIERGKIPAPLSSKKEFIDSIGNLYDRYCDKIDGIALSMPGFIDSDKGKLFESGVYASLYGEVIPDLLKGRCHVPISVENDGKCAALSEVWNGALSNCDDGVVIILGSAIAGAVIKNRKIHGGRNSVAGEISYLITDPSTYSKMSNAYMSVGMVGLTYKTCKAKNIDISIQDAGDSLLWLDSIIKCPYRNEKQKLSDIKVDGVQFFKWLREGDEDVVPIYHSFIHSLATMILNIQFLYAPEKIVIGGGLSREACVFEDLDVDLNRYYEGMGLVDKLKADVVRSKYMDDCNLLGAFYNFMLHNK